MKRLALLAALALVTAGSARAATQLPAHVYAPYFETWTTDGLTTTAQQSGAKYFTLAFLETLSKTSCTLAWNGSRNDLETNGRYLDDIQALRSLGGDVIPSFGGWSADQGGTELADSCKDVNAIAAAYEDVITRYDVSRLDMDIEGRSLRRSDGIDRRNRALRLVRDWAAAQGRPFQLSYTLPASPSGLHRYGLAVLRNAVRNGTPVDVVNVMAFDYHRFTRDMGAAALSAANGLIAQLHGLYPTKTRAQLNAMVGITLMPGLDDYPPKSRKKTTLAHAQHVYDEAVARGFNTLSIWSIQRDNLEWDFSHVLEPFTA